MAALVPFKISALEDPIDFNSFKIVKALEAANT
jgi:hypothetical protein